MGYQVDFNKSPDSLVVALFNASNEKSYTTDTLKVHKNPKVLSGEFDTALTVETLVDDVDIPTATIRFNRIPLSVLFSLVTITLREVDIIDADREYVDSLLLSEVGRRYGISVNPEDFTIEWNETEPTFVAKDTNPAYTGSIPIQIEASLVTRVAITKLRGFGTKDLEKLISVKDVKVFEQPVVVDDKASISRITYGMNSLRYLHLLDLEDDGTLTYLEDLNEALTRDGIPTIEEGTKFTARETSEAQGDNVDYTHVVVSEPINTETHEGFYYFHYNG